MNKICLVGERGIVSQVLQNTLKGNPDFNVEVISTDIAIGHGDMPDADLYVLATQDFTSPLVEQRLSKESRILDISPAFRTHSDWVYGLPELHGQAERITNTTRVANPGCFATSAILLLEPLLTHGFISSKENIYLDSAGGYTTGGSRMIEKSTEGKLHNEAVYSLLKEHRHTSEIKHVLGLDGSLILTPKIVNVPRGIRTQFPVFKSSRDTLLMLYQSRYAGTEIRVSNATPKEIPVDDWANHKGASIYIYQKEHDCLVICTLDNLGKGAIDSAIDNIKLMLS